MLVFVLEEHKANGEKIIIGIYATKALAQKIAQDVDVGCFSVTKHYVMMDVKNDIAGECYGDISDYK